MKRLLIYLVFFFICTNTFAQYNSGVILYKTTQIPDEKDLTLPVNFREAKKKIGEVINTLEFTLKFNRESSLYNLNERLALDTNEHIVRLAIITTRANRLIYTNPGENLIIEQTSFLDKKFLIKSDIDNIQWNLTKEKKDIGDYQCYKALGVLNYTNHKGELKQFKYIAWYSPEVPFGYGPFECSGLPGLVLEFSNGKIIFSATQIKLLKESLSVERPKEGKLVSKEEYNQVGKSAYENNRN